MLRHEPVSLQAVPRALEQARAEHAGAGRPYHGRKGREGGGEEKRERRRKKRREEGKRKKLLYVLRIS